MYQFWFLRFSWVPVLVTGTARWVGQEVAVVGLREVAEATGNWLVWDRTGLTCKGSERGLWKNILVNLVCCGFTIIFQIMEVPFPSQPNSYCIHWKGVIFDWITSGTLLFQPTWKNALGKHISLILWDSAIPLGIFLPLYLPNCKVLIKLI